MISSKILLQSATAGLMAGAILAAPLFLFESDEQSRCERVTLQPTPHRIQTLEQSQRHVLRAAPPLVKQRTMRNNDARRRSLEQRNQAAREALQQLNKAYEHSDAQQRGVQTAHSVAIHTMAHQSARRVNLNALEFCKTNRETCQRLEDRLEQQRKWMARQPLR